MPPSDERWNTKKNERWKTEMSKVLPIEPRARMLNSTKTLEVWRRWRSGVKFDCAVELSLTVRLNYTAAGSDDEGRGRARAA